MRSRGGKLGKLISVLLVCHAVSQFHFPNHQSSTRNAFPPIGLTPSGSDSDSFRTFIAYLKEQPGLIFSTELSFATLAKKQTYPSFWSIRLLGDEQFLEDIQTGKIQTYVGDHGDWIDLLQQHTNDSFQCIRRFDNLFGRKRIEVWSRAREAVEIVDNCI